MRSTRAAGNWTCPRIPRSVAGSSSQTCGAAPQCPGSGFSRRDSDMLARGWTPGRLVGGVQSVHLHQEVVEHLPPSELEKQDARVECFLLRAWIPAVYALWGAGWRPRSMDSRRLLAGRAPVTRELLPWPAGSSHHGLPGKKG